MAANTYPIYTITPNISRSTFNTFSTRSDGVMTIGTDAALIFSSGSNGSYIEKIKFTPIYSSFSLANKNVVRAFLSTVLTGTTTSANTFLLGETVVTPNNVSQSTSSSWDTYIYLNFAIPANRYILVTCHNSGELQAVVYGYNY